MQYTLFLSSYTPHKTFYGVVDVVSFNFLHETRDIFVISSKFQTHVDWLNKGGKRSQRWELSFAKMYSCGSRGKSEKNGGGSEEIT